MPIGIWLTGHITARVETHTLPQTSASHVMLYRHSFASYISFIRFTYRIQPSIHHSFPRSLTHSYQFAFLIHALHRSFMSLVHSFMSYLSFHSYHSSMDSLIHSFISFVPSIPSSHACQLIHVFISFIHSIHKFHVMPFIQAFIRSFTHSFNFI